MGIQGLIPFLEKASCPINISDYSGCTVGIDAYCWLHKGIYTCADKLAKGESTTLYVHYCMKLVNMLLCYNIKPILVFDGQSLVAKGETENKRREIREMNRKKGAELLRLDKTKEAEVYLKRCIDVTHEMAINLMNVCRLRNVDCIVAPFESDAQLAYFSINNIVHLVITEDSDLLLFGCKKVLFKMDFAGNGLLIEQDNLHIAMDIKKENFTMDRFRYMCMLSGCDYLPSLRGIGLVKAHRFIKKVTDTNIHRAISHIGSYLNMPRLNVTLEYRDNFLAADAAFLYHPVFDPFTRTIVSLNPLPIDTSGIPDYLLNIPLSEEQAIQLSYGNLDPGTLEQVNNWDPSTLPMVTDTRKLNHQQSDHSIATHSSIWHKDYLDKRKSPVTVLSPTMKSVSASSDDVLCVKSSAFSKKLFQNVFAKKPFKSSSSGGNSIEKSSEAESLEKEIVNEYRCGNAKQREMTILSDYFKETTEMVQKISSSPTESDSTKFKRTDANDSCYFVSRYFASPPQKERFDNRLDLIDSLDTLESKLSKIEKSINDDISISDDLTVDSFGVSVNMKSPLKQRNESSRTSSVRQITNDDEDISSLSKEKRKYFDRNNSENNEMVDETINRPGKRRNPFVISPEEDHRRANSQKQYEGLFNWNDYVQNQIKDRPCNNNRTIVDGGISSRDVRKQFKSPVSKTDKPRMATIVYDRNDKSVADIMSEDEDEGFVSPTSDQNGAVANMTDEFSTDDTSDFSFNVKRNSECNNISNCNEVSSLAPCRTFGLSKKTLNNNFKQTSLKDLFGFNFVLDRIVGFYAFLKNLFYFPSAYGN